jgi:predicted TIM-barrel fold metal-dependent hydrolase
LTENTLDGLPECEPHDPQPRRPRIAVPAHACDTHAHVCGPRDRFPLVANRLYNPPEASVAEYRHMLNTLGLERGVLVQPSVYGTDNRAMLEALAQDPQRLRAVAVLPFDVSAAEVERLHALGVRGVRCNIVDLKTGKGQLPLDGLRQVARTIAPYGWHIEFLMHVNEFPDLDRQLAGLPVPVVFGHLGYVPTQLGATEGFEALLRLAKAGQAWIKLTAPYRLTAEALPYPTTNAAAQRLVDEVPQRLLWGSDWPHVFIKSAMPNDGDLFNLFLDWVGDRDLLQSILVDNPARVYDFH